MRLLTIFLWGLLFVLQYQLWFGQHGIRQLINTYSLIQKQQEKNKLILARNKKLADQVISLQNNTSEKIEAHAREDLGMIHQGETFYFIPEQE